MKAVKVIGGERDLTDNNLIESIENEIVWELNRTFEETPILILEDGGVLVFELSVFPISKRRLKDKDFRYWGLSDKDIKLIDELKRNYHKPHPKQKSLL